MNAQTKLGIVVGMASAQVAIMALGLAFWRRQLNDNQINKLKKGG